MSRTQRTLVILGASGDLTARLLLPGLGQFLASRTGLDLQLIGVGGEEMTDAAWRRRVTASFKAGGVDPANLSGVVKQSNYLHADATDPEALQKVLDSAKYPPAIYFALPPAVTELVCASLQKVKLPAGTLLALEKPFGTDLKSAVKLNRLLTTLVPERQIHRIDHFLGKSTVLNLLGLRFANRIFEESWNATNIERVDISYDETLGLEGRAGYYDHAGALVDMIQSHLLQVLAVVAMEPPSTVHADDLRGAMAQVLRATHVWQNKPNEWSRRARYTAGTIDRRALGAYAKEPGVDPARQTETLAEITFAVDNWRWAGVPFTLRSGKALDGVNKGIAITFKAVPHLPTGLVGPPEPSQLRIALDPDLVELDVNMNGAGDPFVLDTARLSSSFGPGALGAYGEVIEGIIDSDPTLSVRGDVAEECWRIVGPVLAAWRKDAVPLENYRAGSHGPSSWKQRP
ncbi:MAG: glucose-6-phosphate dehydrogenase [Glaciihabitans sp.]|jgi:glucose-6-phosphate 1-dehydrogenase|nr:glucose-6-phosphate dehydrogenase [Glaciihabitans sp.]